MVNAVDIQLLRAVANTLWPYLKANAWSPHKQVRAISATGNPRGYGYSPGAIPGPTPTVEIISVTWQIRTWLWSDQWPGHQCYAIELRRAAYEAALSCLPHGVIAEYEAALEQATCRKPFRTERDEEGARRLTRNRDDTAITPLAASALEAIALRADLELIPDYVERALLSDADQIDPTDLHDVLRKGERSRADDGPNAIELAKSL